MSKSEPVETTVVEGLEPTPAEQPKPNRIKEFLEAKAGKGQRPGGKDHQHIHGQPQHTKLKERVRRRP